MKKLLIVSATPFEIASILNYLEQNFSADGNVFKSDNLEIHILVTGIGAVNMTFQLTRLLSTAPPYDLVINAGLGGAFDTTSKLGDVVNIVKDTFADIGVFEMDNKFVSAFELRFINGKEFPFTDDWIVNPDNESKFLPNKTAITVNAVSGSPSSIMQVKEFNADIESMEGAGFAFVCANFSQKYLQIRAVSNYIEPRNRGNWEVELALTNLNEVLKDMIEAISEG